MREKLIKIGATVVRHGGYITFQLAEVAIPRSLFANIQFDPRWLPFLESIGKFPEQLAAIAPKSLAT